jgi:DNA uptake protein ComE-like DNA-binding protein
LALLIPTIYKSFFLKPETNDFSKLDKAIVAMEQAPEATESSIHYNTVAVIKPASILFPFDPNTVTEEELGRLGFSNKLTHTLLNYRSKGGKFRIPSDLKKLYGMHEEQYQQLEPYIKIATADKAIDKNSIGREAYKTALPKALPIIELNSADSIALLEVKGIGPAYASRIIKYRQLLGGYVHITQLKEVYGMDSARYSAIVGQLKVNTSSVIKININAATVEALRKHPYMRNFATANALVNYRKQHGDFKELDDMKKCLLIKEELYNKFAPYVSLR